MFDLNRFKRQVLEARRSKAGDSGAEFWLVRETELHRQDGIRIVLETRERGDGAALREGIAKMFAPEIQPEVTRLFPGSDDGDRLSENADLACFWLLRIRGLGILEMDQNPYDLAYLLRDEFSLRSSEPDIPFTGNIDNGSTPPSQVVGTSVRDRAWSLRAMDVPDAWDLSLKQRRRPKGEGIVVGHPDTGYADHVDLDSDRIYARLGWNFVEDNDNPEDPLSYRQGSPGHGTATGSVILSGGTVEPPPTTGEGGTGRPGKVTGVAPMAALVPIRTSRSVWWVFSSDLARAIYHARTKGCHVVSISMGGRGFRHLLAALHDAVKANVIVVAAAGNYSPVVVWPAHYDACIALAATNIDDLPWIGSSCGSEVDISAPGEKVWRAYRSRPVDSNKWVGPSSGTSYATANAAGVAALWLAHHDRDNLIKLAKGIPLQDLFRDALTRSARKPPGWNTQMFGAGIINARALLVFPLILAGGSYPLPTSPDARSLKDLNESQGNIDLRKSRNFIAPSQPEVADIVLTRLFDCRIDSLQFLFQDWGSEIVNLLFDLSRAKHPVFRQVLTELDASRLTEQFRAALCRNASQTLRAALNRR
jgi:hypothetical protein